ncbi:MAG: DUF4239 domain-containing protein [Candidatus Omnitrophica bacterium]|nr:DUF4239 domain-containing protein [Candidatus Omnitrophota bacterium]
MPLAQKILLVVATVPLGVILIFSAIAVSILALFAVKRFAPRGILGQHTELTASIFEAVGMAYTVMLAFMVVVSWQNFDRTSAHVASEANELMNLYRDSEAFPDDFREKIRTALKEYYALVTNEEWELLARGEESEKARKALMRLWEVYVGFEPKTENEIIFLTESVTNLNDLREARSLRLIDSRTGINSVLWFILIVGGIATIFITFFFEADNLAYHALVVSVLAGMIMLILLAILLFDYPFTGDINIPVEMYKGIAGF